MINKLINNIQCQVKCIFVIQVWRWPSSKSSFPVYILSVRYGKIKKEAKDGDRNINKGM